MTVTAAVAVALAVAVAVAVVIPTLMATTVTKIARRSTAGDISVFFRSRKIHGVQPRGHGHSQGYLTLPPSTQRITPMAIADPYPYPYSCPKSHSPSYS